MKGKVIKKAGAEVQVVKCPSAFPISAKTPKPPSTVGKKRPRDSSFSGTTQNDPSKGKNPPAKARLLDWHDTAREVRAYGATAFVGKSKRDFEDEQYYLLTGRHKKKPKVPLNIVQGIKKAAAKRDAMMREEARQAGIVIPKAAKPTKKSDSTYKNHGPAPSIGFMKHGVYRVSDKKSKSTKKK
jgi:hypothetical protein